MPTLSEITRFRQLDELRPQYFVGRRVFICTNADAAYGAHLIQLDYWPSFPALMAAPAVKSTSIRYDAGPHKGFAYVFANYESTGVGMFRMHTQNVATRTKKLFVAGQEGVSTVGGTTIVEGKEADGIHQWYVVSGSNLWVKSHMFFRIDTAYNLNSTPYNTFASLVDKINSDTVQISNWDTAGVGTLWFKGARTTNARFSNVMDTQLFFEYNPAGWNTTCLSRRGVWVSEEHYTYSGTAKTTTTRTRQVFKPGTQINTGSGALEASSAAAAKAIVGTAAFAPLDLHHLVSW